MKILYICHEGALYGSQQSLLLMLRHLPATCFPVVSLARHGPLMERLQQLHRPVAIRFHQRLAWMKHTRLSPLKRLSGCFNLLFCVPFRIRRLCQLIHREKIDLVHTNSVVSLEGALAAWLCQVPHVWHIRELFAWDNPKLRPLLGKRLTTWLMVKLSAKILCISKCVQAQFSAYQPTHSKKIQLLYNAIDMQTIRLSARSSQVARTPLTLGFLGRLSEGKGVHDLLEALKILKDRGVIIQLQIAGQFVDDPYQQKITDFIQLNQLQNQVYFLGFQAELEAFWQSIDMLIVPSLNEPFGRVVIEAMARRLPVIGSQSGALPELLHPPESSDEPTGLLYSARQPEGLAGQIHRLMLDPALQQQIKTNAGRMVDQHFTIETYMNQLHEIYQSLLKQ